MEEVPEAVNDLSNDVIGHAIDVHRHLGPGFTESVYEKSLCMELAENGLRFERQAPVEVFYREEPVGRGIADIVVENRLILELKSVRELRKVHRAQVFSYLRATDYRLGLLLNFNTKYLRDGIRRVVHSPSLYS